MHGAVKPSIVDRIHSGIDDVLAADLSALDDRRLCEEVVELHRTEARLAAARHRLVAELDRREAYRWSGAQSAAAFVTAACRRPGGVARHEVRTARALRHLPNTFERLAVGDLDLRTADRIASLHENPRVVADLERDEATLADEASRLPYSSFQKVLAYWLQHADPDGADDDAEARRARRHLYVARTLEGSFALDGLLDPVDGAVVDAALRRIEQDLFDADRRDAAERLGRAPIDGDLARSARQRRADALVELARRAMASPTDARRPAPLVTVLCSYETFAGRVCELADGTVLAPSDVAALLDTAVIERVVFDGPSRVMDIGHQRRFTGAVRRAIEVRDRTCTHRWCDRPADRCDVDHIEPWEAGGATTQRNGRLLCPFHNHQRQERPPPAPP